MSQNVNKVRINRYYERLLYHLRAFNRYIEKEDIIQAAEKTWGAISAFVNIYSLIYYNKEVKKDINKIKMLTEFIELVLRHDPEVKKIINDFSRGHVKTFTKSLSNLHSFFYGGSAISIDDVKRYLNAAKIFLPIIEEYVKAIHNYVEAEHS